MKINFKEKNMLLTEELKQANKERMLSLVRSIKREGVDVEAIAAKLEKGSDFFEAPASTRYHCDLPGGLCLHTLNVYDNLIKICGMIYPDEIIVNEEELDENGEPKKEIKRTCPFSEDTLKIVALFHDISKMNFYEIKTRNIKVNGEWVPDNYYQALDAEKRFLYGSHEENSVFMTDALFGHRLSLEERVAILHHHGGMGQMKEYGERTEDSRVMTRFPLVLLLHMADMISTFITEKGYTQKTNE